MGRSWYIHTIHGKPAVFAARDGVICYANRRTTTSILVPDLATIRKQQARSRAWYRTHGFLRHEPFKEGYISFPREAKRKAAKPR